MPYQDMFWIILVVFFFAPILIEAIGEAIALIIREWKGTENKANNNGDEG